MSSLAKARKVLPAGMATVTMACKRMMCCVGDIESNATARRESNFPGLSPPGKLNIVTSLPQAEIKKMGRKRTEK